jgi:hypothetical protein
MVKYAVLRSLESFEHDFHRDREAPERIAGAAIEIFRAPDLNRISNQNDKLGRRHGPQRRSAYFGFLSQPNAQAAYLDH